ncbi:hypothetical protein CONPUDRAFT_139491 [Coniophora puteana RWD-64-598 SS2]|uniref:Uncharacterized protein n=1 Tax=Coniophora puteana (strain RWD-64-598) TaxID=741705 RepID=A0A5M3MCC8_CONPW|nr:uncharacterized protein CONPUDRAFT_139491 [Coniophora puteana RWD-64-598 SS2]EIW76858.1 hypothetical protein CONPUDRAFT_139491 [Coniophora puteana RWD-64-598 SS2]
MELNFLEGLVPIARLNSHMLNTEATRILLNVILLPSSASSSSISDPASPCLTGKDYILSPHRLR